MQPWHFVVVVVVVVPHRFPLRVLTCLPSVLDLCQAFGLEMPQSGVFEGVTSEVRGHHEFADLEEFCFSWY